MSHLVPSWILSDAGNRSRLSQVSNWLIDLIFPPVCGCGRVDTHFCSSCLEELLRFPLESRIIPADYLDGLAATGRYDGILEQSVRAFKYSGVTRLDKHLAERLLRAYEQIHWRIDLIIPVPLAEKRLHERGYNQAEMLGARMSEDCGIPYRSDCLRRIRETSQQARLSGSQRRENVRDAFAALDAVKGQSILLIDDVVTTGSTLNACARALQQAGAKVVYGLAVARA